MNCFPSLCSHNTDHVLLPLTLLPCYSSCCSLYFSSEALIMCCFPSLHSHNTNHVLLLFTLLPQYWSCTASPHSAPTMLIVYCFPLLCFRGTDHVLLPLTLLPQYWSCAVSPYSGFTLLIMYCFPIPVLCLCLCLCLCFCLCLGLCLSPRSSMKKRLTEANLQSFEVARYATPYATFRSVRWSVSCLVHHKNVLMVSKVVLKAFFEHKRRHLEEEICS